MVGRGVRAVAYCDIEFPEWLQFWNLVLETAIVAQAYFHILFSGLSGKRMRKKSMLGRPQTSKTCLDRRSSESSAGRKTEMKPKQAQYEPEG